MIQQERMAINRHEFKRCKQKLTAHLLLMFFGGLLSLLLGGVMLKGASGIEGAWDGLAQFLRGMALICIIGGPIAIPIFMIRVMKRSDVLLCPACGVNLLKRAAWVLENSRCYGCDQTVLSDD